MRGLQAVDRLEITIVVDNVTDGLSSVPSFAEGEWTGLARRGSRLLAGRCLCCAAHGLACLITATRDGVDRTLLFDTGPEDYVFERNADRLGLDLTTVDAMMLSHGHWDHGGAMLRALNLIRANDETKRVPVYMHPGMFRTRGSPLPGGEWRVMEDVPSIAALEEQGGVVTSTPDALTILDDMFWISGEIPRVTPFERGLPGQHRRTEDGTGWEPDPLLMDERYLAVDVKGRGLVVFSACSHAGIVNVLTHARASFPDRPLDTVLGGLHLSGSNEEIIPETIAAMTSFSPRVVAAGHCTGWRAQAALLQAFGSQAMVPLAVGKRLMLAAGD